jgi:hypothetical protein
MINNDTSDITSSKASNADSTNGRTETSDSTNGRTETSDSTNGRTETSDSTNGRVYHVLMQVRTQNMGCNCNNSAIFKHDYVRSNRDKLYCETCHPATDDWSNLYMCRERGSIGGVENVLGPFKIEEFNVDVPQSNLIWLQHKHLTMLFQNPDNVRPFIVDS